MPASYLASMLAVMSDAMKPGATALQVIPRPANSRATVFVRPMTPACSHHVHRGQLIPVWLRFSKTCSGCGACCGEQIELSPRSLLDLVLLPLQVYLLCGSLYRYIRVYWHESRPPHTAILRAKWMLSSLLRWTGRESEDSKHRLRMACDAPSTPSS